MKFSPSTELFRWVLLGGSITAIPLVAFAQNAKPTVPTVQNVAALAGSRPGIQISISEPMQPQVQLISNPDRLILDFAGALPAPSLKALQVNREQIKSVRVGLFTAKPPVTRVVMDLSGPQPYEVQTLGDSVVVRMGSRELTMQAKFQPASFVLTPSPTPAPRRAPKVRVDFRQGLLSIRTDRATLAEVLNEVHRKTGADIPLPAGSENEQVVTNIAPAPPREAIASLLNGSRYNFIVMGADKPSAQLFSVLLTLQTGGISQSAGSNFSPPPAVVASRMPVSEPTADADDGPQPDAQEPQPPPTVPQL